MLAVQGLYCLRHVSSPKYTFWCDHTRVSKNEPQYIFLPDMLPETSGVYCKLTQVEGTPYLRWLLCFWDCGSDSSFVVFSFFFLLGSLWSESIPLHLWMSLLMSKHWNLAWRNVWGVRWVTLALCVGTNVGRAQKGPSGWMKRLVEDSPLYSVLGPHAFLWSVNCWALPCGSGLGSIPYHLGSTFSPASL
jgi:hypothetical protein